MTIWNEEAPEVTKPSGTPAQFVTDLSYSLARASVSLDGSEVSD